MKAINRPSHQNVHRQHHSAVQRPDELFTLPTLSWRLKTYAMPRQDISRLSHNRNIYLKLGFLIAIGFSILAFQWEVDIADDSEYYIVDEGPEEMEVFPPRTTPEKEVLPPPPDIETVSPEIEDIEIIFDPVPQKQPEDIIDESVVSDEIVNDYEEPKILIVPDKPIPEKKDPPPIVIEDWAEQMPRFPGCEEEGLSPTEVKKCAEKEFFTFLRNELRYPAMAREAGVKGTVVLQFVVNEDGSLTDMEVLKDLEAGCGRESLRVAKKMPNWIPGKQRGIPVKVRMRLPIKFKLLD